MPKYTIEIDGLPEGYEPAEKGFYNEKLMCITISLRRKIRKYDWSKTLDDVLVTRNELGHSMKKDAISLLSQFTVSSVWQPNIHGECPVDPEASIVQVRFADGSSVEGIAGEFFWASYGDKADITAYQFLRLADNAEW